jgi:hypothetical protein
MLTRRIALVLRVGAVVFAVSALALLLEPSFFVRFIGVVGTEDAVTPELTWAMRMIGAVLVAAFASERTLRQVASIMVPVCLTLSFLTVVAPGSWTLGRWGYIAVGTAFASAYLYGLQGRRRNH